METEAACACYAAIPQNGTWLHLSVLSWSEYSRVCSSQIIQRLRHDQGCGAQWEKQPGRRMLRCASPVATAWVGNTQRVEDGRCRLIDYFVVFGAHCTLLKQEHEAAAVFHHGRLSRLVRRPGGAGSGPSTAFGPSSRVRGLPPVAASLGSALDGVGRARGACVVLTAATPCCAPCCTSASRTMERLG